jgi:cytochrome c oxidase subunit 4
MASTKLYAIIYVLLFAGATAQILIEESPVFHEAYWIAFGGIIVLSAIKAMMVAGWYQHLRYEPRGLTYLMLSALAAALALTLAAAYSIT